MAAYEDIYRLFIHEDSEHERELKGAFKDSSILNRYSFQQTCSPPGCGATQKGRTMPRNALIASLAGAIALGFSAFSAQAASVPMSDAGLHSGKVSLIQKAHYRDYRHYRHHRFYRHDRDYRHHRHHRSW
jgi:hypothetical protein